MKKFPYKNTINRARNYILPNSFLSSIKNKYNKIDHSLILIILSIGFYLYIMDLGSASLKRWDEAIYANLAANMVRNGDWIIPHGSTFRLTRGGTGYQPFLEKPPLVFWLQGLSAAGLGVTRFAVRLPVAIFGILSGILVYIFGKKLYGRKSGIIGAIVLLTTPMIFTGGHGARTASTDVPLMFFGTLFVFLTWTALTGNRSELLPLVGIAAGLAILTKSFNAGIFLIAVAPVALYHIKIFISHKTADMIALTAVISIPWYAYAWIKYQDLFIYEIFTSQALQRATGESFGRQSDTLFGFMRFRYFQEFPSFFNPWSYFLFSAIIGLTIIAVTLRENSEIKKFAFLVWWAASIFIFFIFAGNNGWYIMPMFVPCSILIGRFLSDIPERNPVVLLFTALSIALIVWKSGINIDVILISIGIFGLLLLDTIKTYLDNTISEEDYDLAKKTIPVFLCIMFIIIFASIVPLSVGGPAYSDQEQLGQIANQEVPSEQLIVKTPNVAYSWEFSFYAENTVMRGGINTLNADTDINYALIKSGAKSRITREHTTIADSGQLSLVRLQ